MTRSIYTLLESCSQRRQPKPDGEAVTCWSAKPVRRPYGPLPSALPESQAALAALPLRARSRRLRVVYEVPSLAEPCFGAYGPQKPDHSVVPKVSSGRQAQLRWAPARAWPSKRRRPTGAKRPNCDGEAASWLLRGLRPPDTTLLWFSPLRGSENLLFLGLATWSAACLAQQPMSLAWRQ